MEEGESVEWGAAERCHAVGGGVSFCLDVVANFVVMLESANVWVGWGEV